MSQIEYLFDVQCRNVGIELERELQVIPGRRFRFDRGSRAHRLLIEIHGGTWVRGRHGKVVEDMMDFDVMDPTFVSDLCESQVYVEKAAAWLRRMGYSVSVSPLRIRPDVSVMSEYSDVGDIQVTLPIEVKRRPELYFENRADFPFETVIVDVAHHWERMKPKPWGYIIWNSQATACCLVPGHTAGSWIRTERWDGKRNRKRTFLECPIDLCTFQAGFGDME